ncbi:MAG TPA: hypothetical protein VM783_12035, partial [Candidatus Acidoferrum sp.]|nr:hypothetical protein [Candidatus Acidoferrum sp.]
MLGGKFSDCELLILAGKNRFPVLFKKISKAAPAKPVRLASVSAPTSDFFHSRHNPFSKLSDR